MIITNYPYYKLYKKDISGLAGLVGANVIVQKKYNDEDTIAITSDEGHIYIGNKKELVANNYLPFAIDENFFHESDNLIYYGTRLPKSIVLWDAWDKYNKVFVNTECITKYKSKVYYQGKFSLDLLETYNNHVYRFISPRLTYYV
jgi:hypothetical protein